MADSPYYVPDGKGGYVRINTAWRPANGLTPAEFSKRVGVPSSLSQYSAIVDQVSSKITSTGKTLSQYFKENPVKVDSVSSVTPSATTGSTFLQSAAKLVKGGVATLGLGYVGGKAVDYLANKAADAVISLVDDLSSVDKIAGSSPTRFDDLKTTIPTKPKLVIPTSSPVPVVTTPPVASMPGQTPAVVSSVSSDSSGSTGSTGSTSSTDTSSSSLDLGSTYLERAREDGSYAYSIESGQMFKGKLDKFTLISVIAAASDRRDSLFCDYLNRIQGVPTEQKAYTEITAKKLEEKKAAEEAAKNKDSFEQDYTTDCSSPDYYKNSNLACYGTYQPFVSGVGDNSLAVSLNRTTASVSASLANSKAFSNALSNGVPHEEASQVYQSVSSAISKAISKSVITNEPMISFGEIVSSVLGGASGYYTGASPYPTDGKSPFSSFGPTPEPSTDTASDPNSQYFSASNITPDSSPEDIQKIVLGLQARNLELQNELLEYKRTPTEIPLINGEPPVLMSPRHAEFIADANSGLKDSEINNEIFDDDDFDFEGLLMPFLPFSGISSDIDSVSGKFGSFANYGTVTHTYGSLATDDAEV